MIKLAVFDFDSTLMDGESVTFLAKELGFGDEVSAITKRTMAGELDFFESLTARVSYLKGLSVSRAKEICANFPYITGAKEIISYLKDKNIMVVVFSGGFHFGTDAAKEILKFDASFANHLHSKNGILTGLVGGEIMFSSSKGDMLKELKILLGLRKDEVMCVGDGANDISMFKESGLNIAFCANEILRQYATYCIDKKDLKEIMEYV